MQPTFPRVQQSNFHLSTATTTEKYQNQQKAQQDDRVLKLQIQSTMQHYSQAFTNLFCSQGKLQGTAIHNEKQAQGQEQK